MIITNFRIPLKETLHDERDSAGREEKEYIIVVVKFFYWWFLKGE